MIAAYGKLSVSKEYLRHNCHDGVALQFREWMDSGFDYAGSRGLVPRAGADARRVFFAPSDTQQSILSIAAPSKDASGTREFPFALMALVSSSRRRSDDRFRQIDTLWSSLEEAFDRLVATTSSDAFFEEVRSLDALEVESESFDAWEGTASAWIEGLYRYDAVDLFVRALWRLKTLESHLEAATAEVRRLQVPIDRTKPLGVQIDVWQALLARFHRVYDRTPSVYAPRPKEASKPKPGGAWLIYDEPGVTDFGAAAGGDIENGSGVDLVDNSARLPVDGLGAFRERLEATALRPDAELSDLVEFSISG